jgi:hypothetical protein
MKVATILTPILEGGRGCGPQDIHLLEKSRTRETGGTHRRRNGTPEPGEITIVVEPVSAANIIPPLLDVNPLQNAFSSARS